MKKYVKYNKEKAFNLFEKAFGLWAVQIGQTINVLRELKRDMEG